MDKSDGKVAWGLGCLVEVVIMFAVVTLLSSDQSASLIMYMMILAIPMAIVRFFFFTDGTPYWLRVFIGPIGMGVCLVAALLFPFDVSQTTDKTDGEITMERGQVANSPSSKTPAPEAKEKVEDVLAELDGLVGLEGVKAEVKRLVNLVKINEARRKQGMKVPPMTYHMVFTGNPGTGKTTVARLVARILKCLGIVEKGQLVETDAIVDSAMGGILFIDEAYQLVGGDNDDYGKEAIATLLKRMEDDRDKFVVIAAGYTDEMRDFLDANSGLRSRFARTIEFADYSAKELALIFRSMAKKKPIHSWERS